MKIALDYDGTYTEDPSFWDAFIKDGSGRGHDIFIVTYRDRDVDNNEQLTELEDRGVSVFFTGGVAKKFWCAHWGPGRVDVWIDDKPEVVYQNSEATPEFLAEWRLNNKKVG